MERRTVYERNGEMCNTDEEKDPLGLERKMDQLKTNSRVMSAINLPDAYEVSDFCVL